MCTDQKYLYVGTNVMVIVVEKAKLSIVAKTGKGNHKEVTAMAVDAQHLYVAATGAVGNFNILKFNKDRLVTGKVTGVVEGTFLFPANENVPYSMLVDGQSLYTGMYNFPGQVVQIDKKRMVQTNVITLGEGQDDIRWLAQDDYFVYANTNTVPGQVVRLKKPRLGGSDGRGAGVALAVQGSVALKPGEDHLLASCIFPGSSFLFIGTNTAPGKVVKIDVRSMARLQAVTLQASEPYISSLVCDDEFVYATTYTIPAFVIKLRQKDLKRVATLSATGGGEKAAIMASDPVSAQQGSMYIGTDTDPGTVRAQ
jgi:hypothetical protein